MKVADIMKKDIVSVQGDTSIQEAAEIIVEKKIGSIAISDDGVPVGIVTEKDFVKYLASGRATDYVGDIMSAPLIRVKFDAELQDALKILSEHGIKHLFVEGEHEEGFTFGEIIGIISVRDVIKNLPDPSN
ncbi:CBS domain-containing protein [archaeon]|nr:CBS domain-containing protein [archaeon]